MVTYTLEALQRAIRLASHVHNFDSWGDFPYQTHLALAASYIQERYGNDYRKLALAWLHDALEDHPSCEEELKREFAELMPALKSLARREGESYDAFIERVLEQEDSDVVAVKWADMSSNLHNAPPERLRTRYERHIEALERALP